MATQNFYSKYMLVDGNALIHRGYHAIPYLTTKSGEQVNAVYGFSLILLKAIKELKPTHIACTFDLAGPTFRHEQYKDYKATRVKADQELYNQIPRVKEVVRALNIPIFEKQGFEADDLLGTLSRTLHKQNPEAEIIIATGDMDTLQLVNHKIKVYTLKKGVSDTTIYDEKAVRERYELLPNQLVDYRALKGDPSDNIPGVKGIGEKGAEALIKHFGNINNLYVKLLDSAKENGAKFPISNFQFPNKFQIANFKSRILNLLINQESNARMSYELSKIDCSVPVEINVPEYNFNSEHLQNITKLFQELEFRSLINKLPKQADSRQQSADSNQQTADSAEGAAEDHQTQVANYIGKQDYTLIDTPEKLENLLTKISTVKELVIDTETTGLNIISDKLVGIGLCAAPGQAFYVTAELALASEELKKIIASPQIKKIGHNIKFDLQILSANRLALSPVYFDTMIASYLLNPSNRQHNLEALAFNELAYQMQPIEELIGKGKHQITMDKVEKEKVSWYCCEDTDITFRLKEILAVNLKKENLEKIFFDIEMPLVDVLSNMEIDGIKLNSQLLNKLSGETEINLKELEQKIYKMTGEEFNLNSPKQMKEVLFEKLKLEPIENKKTKTGLSTAASELEKMLGQHPVIEEILKYRELSKMQSTYLLALPQLVNKKTGRLHTSYNQTIAATGRLSSTDPNLQNIPVRGSGLGSLIRQAFVAENGFKLLSIDYSQIELRIVAHLSQDKKMMEVFKSGEDIHTKTAMEIFGVPAEKVTADMRRDAKTINFGILYGVSSFGLSSRITEMSRQEAKEYIAKYFAAYPKVEEYIEQIKLQVHEEAFVRNELGRIRKFPEIKSSQFFVRAAAERAAINFPIQSLAADVIKVAMINIHKELSKGESFAIAKDSPLPEVRMLLQVHDELVFEVKEDKLEFWAKKLISLMESAVSLSVPIKAEAKVGDNWGEMQPIS